MTNTTKCPGCHRAPARNSGSTVAAGGFLWHQTCYDRNQTEEASIKAALTAEEPTP